MVKETSVAISKGLGQLAEYDEKRAERIKKLEEKIDKYEDVINSYLVKLSATDLTVEDSYEMTKLLHVISGFERISDHAVHISVHAREMMEGNMKLSQSAKKELTVIATAVLEAMDMTSKAFRHNNIEMATDVEAIEQVIDKLTARAKNNHIERMLKDNCTFEQGLVYNDILSALERVSDHCSDICASMIEISHSSMGVHEYLHEFKSKDNPAFRDKYYEFKEKYKFS
jgi:phosphate:Na+ symporter